MKPASLKRRAEKRPRAPSPSLNEHAYLQLKEALVTLVYKPGEHLNLAQIMERLSLGRTPANQAVHRLAMEGLVRIIPRKGILVAPLSIDDAVELIEVRIVNEGLCARLAAQRATAAQLDGLKVLMAQFDEAVKRRDTARLMNADREFHELLAQASGNRLLAETLGVLHARAQRFWATSLSVPGHIGQVREEHLAIVAALERRDPDAAVVAIEGHIRSFNKALVSPLR